ncbi:ATPase, T2SS/T4P/T4SS family [Rubellimicrobium aerolatum]|uniref:ATPase, T2SS/T4P/T4SS family n=1 Tax=Rubellimicrobium aerolatum TaxID=490979 RepID=A0ABW0SE27_9RHOB|nr:ATPase, T2SS/T4P/T4SS family [Rubellimicrobium aerolatum]MBP1806989.1 type IV secretion system protein VirB11 [Rubellimicrobium aerolatum]
MTASPTLVPAPADPVPVADSYLAASLQRLGPAVRRDDVIEIAVNPDGRVWGEFQGDHAMRPLGVTLTPVQGRDFAAQIASAARAQLSDRRPILSVSILHGGRPIRAQVVTAPAVAGPAPAISLRFFSAVPLEAIRLDWLYEAPQSLEARRRERNAQLRAVVAGGDLEAALAFCVHHRLNLVVSGGTNTGKTVVLRKLLDQVPVPERLVTIEDAAELHPRQPNVVTLLTDRDTPERSPDRLLTSTLRMRPDRIILGEVRGAEAMAFLEAINTGHGGSMTTLHAETPQLAVKRLAIAASKANLPMTYAELVAYVEGTIDVILQVGRHGDRRGPTEFHLPGLHPEDDQAA